jgi:hypothetical protein
MKTYYMITTNLTFFVNIQEEGKIPFIQSIAETLMSHRGFGCDDYVFSSNNKNRYKGIDLTDAYTNYYLEFYKDK